MPDSKLIQFHQFESQSAVLLNRDGNSLAKRITIGGVPRTRISSQSRKRQWAMAEGEYSLSNVGFVGVRSREIVTISLIGPLRSEAIASEAVLDAVEAVFNTQIYGRDGTNRQSRSLQLFGLEQIEYFAEHARAICEKHSEDVEDAQAAAMDFFQTHNANHAVIRDQATGPDNIRNALFGSMVTSDYAAGGRGAAHVAHSFTTHEEQPETDYLSVFDDLAGRSGHLEETELNSGIFYSYVALDVPQLISNLEGSERSEWKDADRDLTGRVVHNLMHLMARNSPGAKQGSTAPFTYASFVLVEIGSRQPRTLAEAFQMPTEPNTRSSISALSDHLAEIDDNYGRHEARHYMTTIKEADAYPDAQQVKFSELVEWVNQSIVSGSAE